MKAKGKEKEKEKKRRREKKRRENGYARNRTRDLRRSGPKAYHKATWDKRAKSMKFNY